MTLSYHAKQHDTIQLQLFVNSNTHARICRQCGIEKSLEDFTKVKACRDGRASTCKRCTRLSRRYRKANPPRTDVKICSRCNAEKPLDEFGPAKRGKYGRMSTCRQCTLEQRRIRENRLPPPIKPIARPGYKFCGKCGKEHQVFRLKGTWCKTCEGEYFKARYQIPEWKEHIRKRCEETKERRQENRASHYLKNKEKSSADSRAWKKANPDKVKAISNRRRIHLANAVVEPVSYSAIIERDGYLCYICGKPIDPTVAKMQPGALTFDHKVPLQPRQGNPQGSHAADNIHPAHHACNTRKSNIPFECLTNWQRRGI